jgi:ribosomal protein L39E
MINVINFPVCQNIKGRHWYGGRAFKTKQEVIDTTSDRDWRRII